MNLAPMIARFTCWTFAWASLGAIAGAIIHSGMQADSQFVLTIMVATGSLVGAIGGAAHTIIATIHERDADEAFLRKTRRGLKPEDSPTN